MQMDYINLLRLHAFMEGFALSQSQAQPVIEKAQEVLELYKEQTFQMRVKLEEQGELISFLSRAVGDIGASQTPPNSSPASSHPKPPHLP